jgi:cysteine desulfurase
MAQALELCLAEQTAETERLGHLRDRLASELMQRLDGVSLNGPDLKDRSSRLAANLNLSFAGVDGEALMLNMPGVAVSSGSACTAASPAPSHVLRALGLDDDRIRSSLRFGLGRFNSAEEIDWVIDTISHTVESLRRLSRTG